MTSKREQFKELLNAYIDNELSERRRNEVKRLIENDPKIKAYVNRLLKARNLIAAIGETKAPEGIEQSVRESLERRLILNEYDKTAKEDTGQRHHYFRKMVGIAAIVALFAFLSVIVFQVITPSKNQSDVSTIALKELEPLMRKKLQTPAKPRVYNIALTAENLSRISDSIDRSVKSTGLSENSVKRHKPGIYTYQIECTRDQAQNLMLDMQQYWKNISRSKLTFNTELPPDKLLEVSSVNPDQILAVITSPNDEIRLRKIERFTAEKNVELARKTEPEPVKPRLTSSVADTNQLSQTDKPVILKITIKQAE